MKRIKKFNNIEKLGQYIIKSRAFAKSNDMGKVELCDYVTGKHKEYVYLLTK